MAGKVETLAGGLADYYAELAAIAAKAKEDARPLKSRARCTSGYPRLSHAMGVHKTQVDEAKAKDAAMGVPTDYSPDGRPEFRTRGHQKKWLKAHGYVNQDGGYGD